MDDSLDFKGIDERRRAIAIKWGVLSFSFVVFTLYGIFQL
jgi:hypothetical protein